MKLIENDFDRTYEELNKLTEASNTDALNFDDILHLVKADDSTWTTIKQISEQIKANFKSNYYWTYQFQLMYNAYQTEKYTLELLSDTTFINELQQALNQKVTLKRVLAKNYKFNQIPNQHEVFSAALVDRELNDAPNYVDIIPANNKDIDDKDIIKNIEVKATVRDNKIKNTHKAELVFIYYLDVGKVSICYKGYTGKWPGKVILIKDCPEVINRCISVNFKLSIDKFNPSNIDNN